jgi:hypothetical protein
VTREEETSWREQTAVMSLVREAIQVGVWGVYGRESGEREVRPEEMMMGEWVVERAVKVAPRRRLFVSSPWAV